MTTIHHDVVYIEIGNAIADCLEEDLAGANGDLSPEEIRYRLMGAIAGQCSYQFGGDSLFNNFSMEEHADKPAFTLRQVTSLILGVWRCERDAL